MGPGRAGRPPGPGLRPAVASRPDRRVGHVDGGVRIERKRPTDPVAVALVSRYFDELTARFPGGVPDRPTQAAHPHEMSGPEGAFLVAYLDGDPAGCVGLRRLDDRTGEVKHLWVDPGVRGHGMGRQLLGALERVAAELGYAVVRLDTSSHLPEAIALYRTSGYVEIDPYNDNHHAAHWFEKPLA